MLGKFVLLFWFFLTIKWNFSLSLPTNNTELDSVIENRITKLLNDFKQELLTEVKDIVSKSSTCHEPAEILNSFIKTGQECKIRNRRFKEFLYAAEGFDKDSERRRVFTWVPGYFDMQCLWHLERFEIGNTVKYKIKSHKYDEYLYAAAENHKYDEQRREIFTWKPKTQCEEQCYWDIQLVQNKNNNGTEKYMTLRNTEYGEYLYAMDGNLYDEDRRRTFTWKFDGNHDVREDTQSHWSIECFM